MEYNESRTSGNRLRELGGSDFEIKDEQPNIKGWKVKNDSGQIIGEIDELVFDTQDLKVRYIILDLDDNEWDLDSREVLIPIGMAEIDQENDHVILPGITLDNILLLPDYDKDNLTSETEISVRNAFAGTAATNEMENNERSDRVDDFYNHEHFDNERLYRRRRSGNVGQMPDDPFI